MFRKYDSIIQAYKVTDSLHEGHKIHVTEKIDGANASFRLDGEGNIVCFSRNNRLHEGNSLRGFYHWVMENINPKDLAEGIIYYGEWVVHHKISYSNEITKKFILFDLFDVNKNAYLDMDSMEAEANWLGIKHVDVLYRGDFISIEHLRGLVGKSRYCELGEGIVVRNETTGNKFKWVREDFQEAKMIKQPKLLNKPIHAIADSVLTVARVEKVLHKGIDEGVYPNFDKENFGAVMKYGCIEVVGDILAEESDTLKSYFVDTFENEYAVDEYMRDLIGIIKKKIPYIIKEIAKGG